MDILVLCDLQGAAQMGLIPRGPDLVPEVTGHSEMALPFVCSRNTQVEEIKEKQAPSTPERSSLLLSGLETQKSPRWEQQELCW